jgi:transposase-like protein
MPGTRYPEDLRQHAVARALDSHTTVAQVARDVGCSTDTMHRWLREHRQQNSKPNRQQNPKPKQNSKPHRQHDAPPVIVNKTRPVAPQSPATFIPVNLIDSKSSSIEDDSKSTSVEIVTPNGFTLRLADVTVQYIAGLLRELGSC